eukprot:4643633-Pyramimonas_sp.AAC.1
MKTNSSSKNESGRIGSAKRARDRRRKVRGPALGQGEPQRQEPEWEGREEQEEQEDQGKAEGN